MQTSPSMTAFTIQCTRHCYSNFTALSTVLVQKWFHAQMCKSGLQKWTGTALMYLTAKEAEGAKNIHRKP